MQTCAQAEENGGLYGASSGSLERAAWLLANPHSLGNPVSEPNLGPWSPGLGAGSAPWRLSLNKGALRGRAKTQRAVGTLVT